MALSRFAAQFHKLFRCRLCWRVTLAVFAAIFLIEAAILVPSYRNQERDLLNRLNEVSRAAVMAASSYLLHHRGSEFIDVIGQMAQGTNFIGG